MSASDNRDFFKHSVSGGMAFSMPISEIDDEGGGGRLSDALGLDGVSPTWLVFILTLPIFQTVGTDA